MRSLFAPLILMCAFMLAACAAPAPGNDAVAPAPMASKPALEDAAPAATPPAAPARNAPSQSTPEQSQPRSKPAPPMSDPLPPQRVPEPVAEPKPIAGSKPGAVNASCRTDADCTVKNVGNCCGYYPACVNVNSPTDPQGVQAQCAKSGMASVCGFQEISGCQCVQGQCQAGSGAVAQ